jgi:hypothetical protein
MKRRQYIGTVGSIALTPLATAHEVRASADEDENPTPDEARADEDNLTATVKRYDFGTVISVAVPKSMEARSISVEIETADDDQLNHRYIDSAREPIESRDDIDVWHFLHQFRDASETIHLNRIGQPSIEVEKRETGILGNPWIEFAHEQTRKVGEVDFASVQILGESHAQVGFNLDSEDDYDWLSFETYDQEHEEWVEHRWEQRYFEAFDEYRWANFCRCNLGMPTVLSTSGRLKLFGVTEDGEKEHIPLIRQGSRGDR